MTPAIIRLREPFAAGSHLLGSLAAVFGAVYLIQCCDGSYFSVSIILIYSLALIALLLVSGLLHGLHCSKATHLSLERLDYAAIYLFIAATYTPVCFFVIGGKFGVELLAGEWLLALTGIWLALSRGPSSRNAQVCIYLAMGWGFVFALPSLSKALPALPFNLLILGGVFYSIGAIIFACNWPSLFRARISAHDFWHILVLLGSGAHYAFIVQIVS